MEQMYSKSGLAAVIATTVLLGACGGGSGGGGGSSDGGGGGSNATQLQLDPGGYGERQAPLRTQADYQAAARAYEDTGRINELVAEVEDALYVAGSLEADETEVRQASTTACENEGGTVDVTNGTSSTRVVFDNCQLTTFSIPRLILDGTYSQDTSGSDTDQTSVTRYNLSGKNLDTDEPLGIQGMETVRLQHTGESSGTITASTERLEYRLGGDYVALRNTQVIAEVTGSDVTMSLNADLISSSADGSVNVSTPVPVSMNVNDTCPTEGAIRLEADGTIEVRYGLSTGTGYIVEVIVNDSTSEGYDSCDAGDGWLM